MIQVLEGDALTQLATLPAESVHCVITDPVWPNVPPGMFPNVDDPWALLNTALLRLPMGVKRLVIVLRSDSDPRFLSAVPSHRWPFFHAAWMQYALPSFNGRKLGGNEIAYCFGEPIKATKDRHLIPGMCQVKAQPTRETEHPCARSIQHMSWLVRMWSEPGETILDPFAGSGTIGLAAQRLNRDAILIEINSDYAEMARQRITKDAPLFARVA